MGLTCKSVGKMRSITRKLENQLEKRSKVTEREEGDEEG